jgi:hypothetical protein
MLSTTNVGVLSVVGLVLTYGLSGFNLGHKYFLKFCAILLTAQGLVYNWFLASIY